MRLLLAALVAWPAFAQSVSVPVSKVIVGRNCDDRTVTWAQTGGMPDTYTIEWLPVFNEGAAVRYDVPLRFTVPGDALTWRGRVDRAGLFVVRVRAEYRVDGAPTSTSWSESITPAVTSDGAFLFALSICPPGEFEPN